MKQLCLFFCLAANAAYAQQQTPATQVSGMTTLPPESHSAYKTTYIIDVCPISVLRQAEPVRYHFASYSNRVLFKREDLKKLPYTDINDIISLAPGVYQQHRGGEVNIYGGRSENIAYVLDGMQLLR